MLVAGAETLAPGSGCGFGARWCRRGCYGVDGNRCRRVLERTLDVPFARDPRFRPRLNRTRLNRTRLNRTRFNGTRFNGTRVDRRTRFNRTRLEAWLLRAIVGLALNRPVVVQWTVETTVSAAFAATIPTAFEPVAAIAISVAALRPIVVAFATLLGPFSAISAVAPVFEAVIAIVAIIPVARAILAVAETALPLIVVLGVLLLAVLLARWPVVAARAFRTALWFLREALHHRLLGLAEIIHVVAVLVSVGTVEPRAHLAVGVLAHLRRRQSLLFTVGKDDAIVVFGML